MIASGEIELQLKGQGLTTAHVLYRMPGHFHVLQSYVWQDYDIAPDFPVMRNFLEFCQEKFDGPLHSLRSVHQKLIRPGEWRKVDGEVVLH